jgi:crossover junction endodeoxyribonuclease RuvC
VIVLGVDPAVKTTALCEITSVRSDDQVIPLGYLRPAHVVAFKSSATDPTPGTLAKYDRLRQQAAFVARAACRADMVIMEGPSFSSKGSATRDLAGMWWLTFDRLRHAGIPLGIAPPAVLKKWITANGNADKFRVGQDVARRWPAARPQSHDEADALVLASIGLHALDALPWRPTAFQVEQLGRVEWIKWPGERS